MPRVVFVLSQDYGELFNAMYFALGGTFETILLMPPRMHRANQETLPFKSYAYRDAQELAACIELMSPDVVVLFSGYLLVINKLLTEANLAGLLSKLRERGTPLVTSDPSLGLIPSGEVKFSATFAGATALRGHFRWLSEALADAFHVYLAPRGIVGAHRYGSYYNTRGVLSQDERARRAATLSSWSSIEATRPRWLFILSPEDEALQVAEMGRERFAVRVADRMRDAVRAGRQPVLIAPEACFKTVQQQAGELPGVIALSGCGYLRFMLLLWDAEYVFYWNQFSASMLARVINEQPIFTFAPGHLVQALAEIRVLGAEHFYLGVEPTMLDVAQPLELDRLAQCEAEERPRLLEPVSAYLAQSPSPSELIARILEQR